MNDQIDTGGSNQPQGNEAVPPDLYAAQVTGSRETLARLLQTFELDVGCRHPHVEPNPDGTATLVVYATEERIREIQAAGYKVETGENVSAVGRERQAEVAKGDRFEGGRVAPRGLGKKPGHDRQGGSES
jgi:hypothetical protein